MYEQLLKWGLDSLSKFAGIKGEYELSILREVIKTKNAIIIERHKQSTALNDNLLTLSFDVEDSLKEFSKDKTELKTSWKTARQFIGQLKTDFHPEHYRKLCKTRSTFDVTNDLISAYSYVFLDILKIDNLVQIAKSKELHSIGDICRLYRAMWSKYIETISVVLRVTSGDLRFWITDTPYVVQAHEWAKHDLQRCIESLGKRNGNNERFHLSLETKRGLDKFWYDLENYHDENKNKSLI